MRVEHAGTVVAVENRARLDQKLRQRLHSSVLQHGQMRLDRLGPVDFVAPTLEGGEHLRDAFREPRGLSSLISAHQPVCGFMLERAAQLGAIGLLRHADHAPCRSPHELAGDTGRSAVWAQELIGGVVLVTVENHDREWRKGGQVDFQEVGGGLDVLIEAPHPREGVAVTELGDDSIVWRNHQSPGTLGGKRVTCQDGEQA